MRISDRGRGDGAAAAAAALSWAAVAVGFVLLLGRLWLIREGALSPPMLAVVFGALAAASLAGPQDPPSATAVRARAPLPPMAAMALGAVAVGGAAVARARSGPAISSRTTLVVVVAVVGAAIAEEAFFRRLLYGRLLRLGPAVAVVGSALAFGAVHVPLHGTASFPVDLGAGLVLSWQRWAGGRWEVPAATHALANVLAVAR